MNKKNSQLVYAFLIIAFAAFVGILFAFLPTVFEEYSSTKSQVESNRLELEKLEQQDKKLKDKRDQEEIQLQSLKQIYQSQINSSDSLAKYGTMFDDLIKRAQSYGLLIRSIEYDIEPTFDPVYADFSNQYNVCELKFFFVGGYSQLQKYLKDITGSSFPYLISISSLNVTAFTENTDYLLIKMSITLYSKKQTEK